MFFCIRNSLILNKGLMYVNMTPKGETEGVLAFIIPVAQHHMVLNRVHRDARHQGQQWTLALAQERFWWPMMAEDCQAVVRGCPHCQVFKGEVPRAPLCLIRAYAPLELVHLNYTSIESMMELNKPPHGDKCPLHKVCPGCGDQRPDGQDSCKGVLQVLHSSLQSAH